MGGKNSRLEKALDASPDDCRYFGFQNFGNTCYFNSVLQALYFCPAFRTHLLSSKSKSKEEDLLSSLAELFESISSSKKKSGVIVPKRFLAQLRRDNELFNSNTQQDAQEFLNFLLNKISDIEKSKMEEPTSKTWVQQLFEGVLTNETRCLTCETVTTRDECFLDLSIDIEQNTSITSCLRNFSSTEVLSSESKFHCENCCSKQEAQKRMRIKKSPDILALHLKRFKYNEARARMTKLMHRVVHPLELRLFNTTDDSVHPDRIYDLFAMVVHIGPQPNQGHYITIVRSHGMWLLLDDDKVDAIDNDTLESFYGLTDAELELSKSSESAYILFYQARDTDPEHWVR